MSNNLGQFSIDLRGFAIQVEKDAIATVKRVCFAMDKHLVMNTPVDTGRARSNWIPTLEAPSGEQIPPFSPGSKGSTAAANTQAAMTAMATVMATWRLGQKVWIVNNVEYLQWLNDGTTPTKQASPGFVEMAIQAGIREGLRR